MHKFGHSNCISCGKPCNRERNAWRCWPCHKKMERVRSRAKYRVDRAIARGELRPVRELTCIDCGKPATDYDHRDYSKPTDVVPTCRGCNLRRGPGLVDLLAA